MCSNEQPPASRNVHYFSIDSVLVYVNFYADFGPSNIGQLVRFCQIMQEKLASPALAAKRICLYSSLQEGKRANAAFLLCAYMVRCV